MTDNFFLLKPVYPINMNIGMKIYTEFCLERVQLQRGPGYNKQFSLYQKSLRMLKILSQEPPVTTNIFLLNPVPLL